MEFLVMNSILAGMPRMPVPGMLKPVDQRSCCLPETLTGRAVSYSYRHAKLDATVTNMTSFSMDFKNDLVAVTEKNPLYTSHVMVDYNGLTYATYNDVCYFKQKTAAVPVDKCLLCGSYSRTDVIGMADNKLALDVYSVREPTVGCMSGKVLRNFTMNLSVLQVSGGTVIPVKEIGNYVEKGEAVNLAVDFADIGKKIVNRKKTFQIPLACQTDRGVNGRRSRRSNHDEDEEGEEFVDLSVLNGIPGSHKRALEELVGKSFY